MGRQFLILTVVLVILCLAACSLEPTILSTSKSVSTSTFTLKPLSTDTPIPLTPKLIDIMDIEEVCRNWVTANKYQISAGKTIEELLPYASKCYSNVEKREGVFNSTGMMALWSDFAQQGVNPREVLPEVWIFLDTNVDFAILGVLEPTFTPTASTTATFTPMPTITPMVGKWRVTGPDVHALHSFDTSMKNFMEKNKISAGALAVTYKGRLILAHGYTLDMNQEYSIEPTTLFRICSISKPITAVGILKLIQDEKLSIDTRISDILEIKPSDSQSFDSRLNEITVEHLLNHTGGWDRDKPSGFDPMFSDIRISKALGITLPVSQENIISYMSHMPLDYNPGEKYAYSNFGYMLLGRIIEIISGQKYEEYVKQNVLSPLGISNMRLGQTLREKRQTDEVTYYSPYQGTTVLDSSGKRVPNPYGVFNLENMDSHGGWVANVIDIARFGSSFGQPLDNPVLTPDSIKLMFSSPTGIKTLSGYYWYYAKGWVINISGGTRVNYWHDGILDGSSTLMVCDFYKTCFVVLINQRRDINEIYNMFNELVHITHNWPTSDLFQQFP